MINLEAYRQKLRSYPVDMLRKLYLIDHRESDKTADEMIEALVVSMERVRAQYRAQDEITRASLDEMEMVYPVILSEEETMKLNSMCVLLALKYDVTSPKDVYRLALMKLRSNRAQTNIIPTGAEGMFGRSGFTDELAEEMRVFLFEHHFIKPNE